MARHSIEFLKYLAGLRGPRTALTAAETGQLRGLAGGAKLAIEVGVYEGATSAVLAAAPSPGGTLYLIDPFFLDVRLERWLGFSFTGFIARRSVRRWPEKTRFERATSLEAARSLSLPVPADLVFIDAVHSYEAVRDDLYAWSPKLAPEGVLAFHDSRCCAARPDLTPATGPVRLLDEVRRGLHGAWKVVAEADSLTAIAPAGRDSSSSTAPPP
jgi:predicted O-methyltransferase YrrM